IILTWGESYPKSYSLEISSDGKDWREVFKTDKGNGKQDWIYFKTASVRQIRVNCAKEADGKAFILKGFELKSGEEQATSIKTYQALAKDSPPGYYPMWLRRVQEFWTVVGIPDDNEEGLLSETGTFEPYKNGFSAMPFIYSGGKVYTAEDCKISQSLPEDYLPIPSVKWLHSDWSLEITALALGQPGQSMSALKYTFKNLSKEPFSGKFAIAVRPVQLNPVWQHGGFSAINSAECLQESGISGININGQKRLVSLARPAKMAAVSIADGDVIDFIKKGTLPDSLKANSPDGGISVGLLYDLNLVSGEKKDFIVLFPLASSFQVPQKALSNAGAFFEEEMSASVGRWTELLNRLTISIPEERLINVMKTNIAYILINEDTPWIKPGSRNYSHSWLRDGALTSVALLRMGMVDKVRDWVDAVTSKVGEDGYVPFIIFEGGNIPAFNTSGSGEGNEYDSQGEYVFAVRQYIDYSGDKQYLQKVYPKVVKALQFAQRLRRQNMTPEFQSDPKKQPYYGILPKSNSHEGYYPAMTSYWDDFFVLRGFKDGVYLANLMGKKDDAEWMQREVDDFRKCIYDSIRKVAARDKINYIAGCVEKGDFDSTSTAIAIVAGGELDYMPKDLLKNTFDRYFDEFSKGMVPGHERTFTPYEVRSANAYVRMGQRERGLTMLRYFTKDSVRPYGWNHMAEVVYAKPRTPSYIGDMPHTWVGSGYIDAVRTMFVYEANDKLVLGAGIDP
ncbi:MAG: discoidin domain-containing protein, partial [Candidatus Omnitrophota bacterium]|nr:discoidin domain-containing protein [Candidatus Omnitrophota bacterium]